MEWFVLFAYGNEDKKLVAWLQLRRQETYGKDCEMLALAALSPLLEVIKNMPAIASLNHHLLGQMFSPSEAFSSPATLGLLIP